MWSYWSRVWILGLAASVLVSSLGAPVFQPVDLKTPNPTYLKRQQALRSAMAGLPNTNSELFLTFTAGSFPNTLSNLTTGASVNLGTNEAHIASGLLTGSTNSFVVTDTFDQQSNVAIGVAQEYTNKLDIQIYAYKISWPVVAGKTNTLWATSSLTNPSWKKIVSIVGTNVSFSIIQTNSGLSGYWRVMIE